jgi:hypothetical protein
MKISLYIYYILMVKVIDYYKIIFIIIIEQLNFVFIILLFTTHVCIFYVVVFTQFLQSIKHV